MPWRDGCAPRPPVHEGAEPVGFDFEAADAVGARLDDLRAAVDRNLATRAREQGHLVDWAGGHRRTYDELRARHEATLGGDALGTQLGRLRAAWDEAAAAQARANLRAAEVADVADEGPTP